MRKSNFRVHWSRVGATLVLGGLIGAGTVACLGAYETEDIPQCTDKIADTQGICQGAPLDYDSTVYPDPAITPTPTATPESPTVSDSLPPCATEDSDNCYWDAATMGNGKGTSFVTVDGTTYYPRPKDAERAEGPVDGYDEGVLFCGVHAAPAEDVDPYGNHWAYCEPALVDQ